MMTLPGLSKVSTIFSDMWKMLTASKKPLSEQELLDMVCQQMQDFISTLNLSVILRDKRTGELRCILALENEQRLELEGPAAQKRLFHRIGKNKIEDIIRRSEPILLPTREHVQAAFDETEDYTAQSSWMGVPMRLHNTAIGAFIMYHPSQEHAFNEDDLRILDIISDQVAIALDNIRSTHQFKVLAEIERQLTSTIRSGESAIVELVCQQTQWLMDTRNFSIILRDRLKGKLRFALVVREGQRLSELDAEDVQERLMSESARELIEKVLQTGQPVLLQTKQEVRRTFPGLAEEHVPAAWAGVPMRLQDKLIGTFVLYHSDQEYAYDDDDIKILDAISDQTAVALDNVRLTRRIRAASQIKARIAGLSHLDERQILDTIYEEARDVIDTYNLSVVLRDQQTGDFRFAFSCRRGVWIDVNDPQRQAELLQRTSVEVLHKIFRTGEPELLPTIREVRAVFPRETAEDKFPQTWLGVPMRLRQKVVGVFIIFHTAQENVYDEDDVQILSELSDQAAIALDNACLQRQFKILARAEQELTTIRTSDERAVFDLIYTQAQQLIDARNFAIVMQDKLTDTLKIVLAYENGAAVKLDSDAEQQRVFDRLARSRIEQIIHSQQPILLPPPQKIEARSEADALQRPSCWLGVPMRLKDKTIGAFVAYHPDQAYAYNENDRDILDAFSDQAANALDNVRLMQRFTILSEVERKLVSGIRLTIDEVLQLIGEQAQKFHEIDTRNLAIILQDSATEQLRCFLAFQNGGLVDDIQTDDAQLQLLDRLGKERIEQIIQTREPLLLRNHQAVEQSATTPEAGQCASWLGVPMRLENRAIGAFVTYHESREEAYDDEDQHILDAISDQAAIALNNVRLTTQLHQLAKEEWQIPPEEQEIVQLIPSKTQKFKEIDTQNLSILLYDDVSGEPRFVLSLYNGRPLDVGKEKVQEWLFRFLGKERIEQIIATQTPIILKNKQEVHQSAASPEQEKYASWLGVPMRSKNEVIGAFVTYHRTRENVYDEDDQDILDALSDQAASAISTARLLKIEQQQRKQAEVLQEVARIVNSTLDQEHVSKSVLEQLQTVIPYDSASIQRIHGDQRNLIAYHGLPTDTFSDDLLRNISEDQLAAKIVQQRTPEVISDTTRSDLWEQLPSTQHVKSWIGAPLIARDRVIGLLTIDHHEPGFYTPESGELAAAFAAQVATAILNSERARALTQLHHLARRLLSLQKSGDLRTLLEEIADRAQAVLHADVIELYEYRQDRDECVLPPITVGQKRFPGVVKDKTYKDDVLLKLLDARQPEYIHTAQADERFCAPFDSERSDVLPTRRFVVREAITSTAAIPLRTEHEIMGLMFINYRTPQPFGPEQQELIELFAHQAAIAIRNARVYAALKRERELLHTVIETIPDHVYVKNTKSQFILANETVMKALGVATLEELEGKTDFDFHPKEFAERYYADECLVLQGQAITNREEPILDQRYPNATRWLLTTKVPLKDADGHIVGIVGINRDISERKQIEEALRASEQKWSDIINFLPDATFVIDNTGKVIAWNHAIEEMTGVKAEEIMGNAEYEYAVPFYGEKRPILIDLVMRPDEPQEQTYDTIERQGDVLIAENYLQHLNIYVRAKASPLYDFRKNLDGAILTIRDITELRRVQDELECHVVDLEVLNRDLEALSRRQAALITLTQNLASTMGLTEGRLFELIHQNAQELMDVDNMYIALHDQSTRFVQFGLVYENGEKINIDTHPAYQPRRDGTGKTEEIIQTGQPLFHRTPQETQTYYKAQGHTDCVKLPPEKYPSSWLGVPMKKGKLVLGVIATYPTQQDYVYSEDDVEILQAMADSAAIALDNIRLYNNIYQHQEVLIQLAQTLTSDIQLEESKILTVIYQNASKLLDAHNMYIALYDEQTDSVRFPLIFREGQPITVAPREHVHAREQIGRTEAIIRTQQPLFHPTKAENLAWYQQSGHEDFVSGEMWLSWIGVPMCKGDKVLGVIAAYQMTKENAYSQADLDTLQTMANLAAIALDNARLYSEMQQQTKTLEEANRRIAETQDMLTRSMIAADFVHRLNNLAGTIPIWVDMIREEIKEKHVELPQISTHLDNIINDNNGLLRAAEQLKAPRDKMNINVVLMLQSMLRQVRIQYLNEIQQGQIKIVQDIPPNLYKVWGMPSSLASAIFNVIKNGIDSILSKGSGTLHIKANNYVRNDDSTEWVKIEIEDSGTGITNENLSKIFIPFFSTKGAGRGYGLWSTKVTIEESGGSINVASQEGDRTKFTVLLPKTEEG
jgi:PAS domain S-box-containing protein